MKHKMTVAELEAISGNPDSIRNLNGKNARSTKQVATIVKEFKKQLPNMVLPDELPSAVTLTYEDGRSVAITDTKLAALVLNFAGLL